MAPQDAAVFVLKAAYMARTVALRAEPPLNPNLIQSSAGVDVNRLHHRNAPSKPDQNSSKKDESRIMRLAMALLTRMLSLTKHESIR